MFFLEIFVIIIMTKILGLYIPLHAYNPIYLHVIMSTAFERTKKVKEITG